MKGNILLLIICFTSIAGNLTGQVFNFSQYHLDPQFTNPAHVATNDFVEILLKYRQQGLNSDQGFKTPSFNLIMPLFYKSSNKRFGGVGFSIIDERSGANGLFRTSGIILGFGYNIRIGKYNFISTGIQPAFYSKRIDLSEVTTDAQFTNGAFNPSLDIDETFGNDRANALVFNAGFIWYRVFPSGETRAFLGGGFFNLNKPDFSFIADEDNLPLAVTSYGGVSIIDNLRVNILPTFRYFHDVSTDNLSIGSLFQYKLYANAGQKHFTQMKIEMGLWYNTGDFAVISLGTYITNYLIAVSYDIPIFSELDEISANNAIEITLRWRKPRKGYIDANYFPKFGGPRYIRERNLNPYR